MAIIRLTLREYVEVSSWLVALGRSNYGLRSLDDGTYMRLSFAARINWTTTRGRKVSIGYKPMPVEATLDHLYRLVTVGDTYPRIGFGMYFVLSLDLWVRQYYHFDQYVEFDHKVFMFHVERPYIPFPVNYERKPFTASISTGRATLGVSTHG